MIEYQRAIEYQIEYQINLTKSKIYLTWYSITQYPEKLDWKVKNMIFWENKKYFCWVVAIQGLLNL